jgi:hydrogenase maturation protease
MNHRMLIAGIGNIFLGDDGFGVEVANRLVHQAVPDWVRVADFGIRGMHLAYELADGAYETAVLVDASPRGEVPGTVYLIEPDVTKLLDSSQPDGHSMSPDAVFRTANALGGIASRVLIVGCEPANTEEGIGLSEPVANAVDRAVELVRELIEQHKDGG